VCARFFLFCVFIHLLHLTDGVGLVDVRLELLCTYSN